MGNQTIQAISGAAPVQDLSGLDIETAIMTVQSTRAQLLEDQLKSQLNDVKARNERISNLNNTLSTARNLQACFPADAKADKRIADLPKEDRSKAEDAVEEKYKAQFKAMTPEERARLCSPSGLKLSLAGAALTSYKSLPSFKEAMYDAKHMADSACKSSILLEQLKQQGAIAGVEIDVGDKGELDKLVENIKSLIDSESNSQQMDMLRLQSLSNKRNEAFELMTNFIKKMQDSRSSIISGMR